MSNNTETGLVPTGPIWTSKPFLEAFRRGDRASLVLLALKARGFDAGTPTEGIPSSYDAALDDLAQFAIDIRRDNVAVVGAQDVFVRHTPNGDLTQVIAPVRLSLHDDTLYQIPVWGKYFTGTNRRIPIEDKQTKGEWKAVIPEALVNKATITAFGLNVVNKVAGCAIGQPDVVVVDGVERTNPYVERHRLPDGRSGDTIRVVVRVNVVGPAPATGNPVIVQYTLDVDPSKDLQHLLLQAQGDNEEAIFLMNEGSWSEFTGSMEPRDRARWALLSLYGGVGIAHDLRNSAVQKAYSKNVNLLQNVLKKAQTVARRNAMRQHPALAFQTVQIDDRGGAVIGVTGWMSSDKNIARYAQILDRMARGLLPDLAEVDASIVTVDEDYDPAVHATGHASVDAVVEEITPDEATEAEQARNAVIEQIDAGVRLLTPLQVAFLKYDPAGDLPALRRVLTEINRLVDEGGAK